MNILFFGSTADSVLVMDALMRGGHKIVCAVTQPPRPSGRRLAITPTPVAAFAGSQGVTVASFPHRSEKPWQFADNDSVTRTVRKFPYELVVSASFGQKIPIEVYRDAIYGGVNIHPSLLPRWRGADPVPWTIIAGDAATGVSVVKLADTFDSGLVVSQLKVPVAETDFPDNLRTALFRSGGHLLAELLHRPECLSQGTIQNPAGQPYAYKFSRNDGYVPWNVVTAAGTGDWTDESELAYRELPLLVRLKKQNALSSPGKTGFLTRMVRALSPWPGVWTIIQLKVKSEKLKVSGKRLKIQAAHLDNNLFVPDTVQLEGKKPVSFSEFRKAYLLHT